MFYYCQPRLIRFERFTIKAVFIHTVIHSLSGLDVVHVVHCAVRVPSLTLGYTLPL